MVYPEIIRGNFVDLRSITLDDAEFSYNIRSDERNRDTVGTLATSLDAQRKYIAWQMQEPNDYYFVVLNKRGERIGLIGVYDIHGDMGEVGREVNRGEPAEIMEVGLLIDDFCREVLKLKKACCVVYLNNIHHISDVKKKGAKYIRTDVRGGNEALYFESDLFEENATKKKIANLIDKLYKLQQAKEKQNV